jgi:hypothetical protein
VFSAGQRVTTLAACLVLLVAGAVYALVQDKVGATRVPSVFQGIDTAARDGGATSAHPQRGRMRSDRRLVAVDQGEQRPSSAAADARSQDRAQGLAVPSASSSVTSVTSASSAPASSSSAAASSSATAAATSSATTAAAAPVGGGGQLPGSGGALSWAPPAGYANFPVTQVTAAGVLNTVDGHGGDIRIELSPSHPVGPLVITNCRNAVLIGGQIDVLPSITVNGSDQRAVYVSKCTGTVHIEGLLVVGAVDGSESDGIAVNAPNALVQIENVRVDGMRGAMSANHADVFQPWGGVREYRIDRLTGSTNYQGLHIKVGLGPIGRGTIRNTDIFSSEFTPIDRGGNFIWMDCNAYPLTLDNVYIAGRADRSFATSIWPTPSNSGCPAVVSGGMATWPGYTSLTGGVHEGRPSIGAFVSTAAVGLHYVSPGYR